MNKLTKKIRNSLKETNKILFTTLPQPNVLFLLLSGLGVCLLSLDPAPAPAPSSLSALYLCSVLLLC